MICYDVYATHHLVMVDTCAKSYKNQTKCMNLCSGKVCVHGISKFD